MEKQKNIPQLRFPEFRDIWEKVKFTDCCELIHGFQFRDEHFVEEGLPVVKIGNLIENKGISLENATYIDKGKAKEFLKYSLKKGDVLMALTGGTLGKVSLVDKDYGLIFQNYRVGKFKPLSNSVQDYLYILLQSSIVQNRVKSLVNEAAQPNFGKQDFDKIKFHLPPLPEQQKIASFFIAIDQKLSQLKRKKTLLEQYKKGVMQRIFSQEIRFKDDNGQKFPKWEKLHGNKIFETISNKNHNSDLPILAITQEHGAIPRDLIDYNITVTEQSIESYKVVEKGDFIISLRSFQGGIEYSNYKGICSPAYIILRATKEIDNRYFKYYFKTETYIIDLNRKLEGIRDGKMISYKYFSDILINVPSLPEQTKIANFLSALDDKINHTQKQIEKVEVWKKGLMRQMFC